METQAARTYRVTSGWKGFIVVAAPCLAALMIWGCHEIVANYRAGRGAPSLWMMLGIVTLLGGMALVFLAGLVWAFRARIVLSAEQMIVRGALLTRVIPVDRIEGVRYVDGQMHVHLRDRQWPVQIVGFERPQEIARWVAARAEDLDQRALAAEDQAIRDDVTLGLTEEQKNEHLLRLRRIIRGLNLAAFAAAGVAFVEFLFLGHAVVLQVALGTLVLVPALLNLLALANRGHVRADYRDGTRYPQILTGTMVCGAALTLLSLLDTGVALLDDSWYRWFVPLAILNGLLFWFLESDHLRRQRRSAGIAAILSVSGMLLIPSLWVGGSLYQLNKHLDRSPASWHATEVVDKRIARGKTTSYHIELAPWSDELDEPVDIKLKREPFEALDVGLCVEVAVRQGALRMPWVSELRRCGQR